MGSGKSYEAVSSVIVPAIATGRRVVSNIDGLNETAIHEYILARGKKGKKGVLSADLLGSVVHVTNDQVSQPGFFPDPERPEGADAVVQPGDLVVIDEAWRFWPTNTKPSHEHMQFFRMHRHYAHSETGVTSDLALLIQDISGLHPDVKRVVEMTVKTTKLKAVGLSRRYRVDIYEGYKLTRGAFTSSYQRGYDKRVFPLYQSYGSGNATETVVDDRQNIFRGAKVWVILALIPLLIGGGIWYLVGFFSTGGGMVRSTMATVEGAAGSGGSSAGAAERGTGAKRAATEPKLSAEWRIVGVTLIDDRPWVVLQNGAGRLRYEYRSKFERRGQLLSGVIDGSLVTMYSGTGPRVGLMGSEK